jgi:hypothetical protein
LAKEDGSCGGLKVVEVDLLDGLEQDDGYRIVNDPLAEQYGEELWRLVFLDDRENCHGV